MANTNDAHECDMGDDLEITKVSCRAFGSGTWVADHIYAK